MNEGTKKKNKNKQRAKGIDEGYGLHVRSTTVREKVT